MNVYTLGVQKYIPLVNHNSKSQLSWQSNELKKLINQKKRLWNSIIRKRYQLSDSNQILINYKKLKRNWKDDPPYLQSIGDEFLNSKKSLVLKVPSAIIELENNFIINPAHPDMKKIKILSCENFIFDKRLSLKNE
jgi:RES domain-containing protein